MLTFNIHLNTINDFRKYAAMEAQFRVRGYVLVRGARTDMYDLLDLMAQGPVRRADLVLTQYQESEKEQLGEFLKKEGLLNENCEPEDSFNCCIGA